VVHAYVSDADGNFTDEGTHITLVLAVAPNDPIGSPIQYSRNENCPGNNWIDYKLAIVDATSGKTWNKEVNRIIPLIDAFDLSGKFTHQDVTMSYATYTPPPTRGFRPLIIWLHGGGEGGTDPSIPLIANRAANYASDEIQTYFDGAYVLVPQAPTYWMDSGEGYTRGDKNDIYNEALMALFKDFVTKHRDIDTDRIYVGGCSNGGYMSLKLILEHPDYFAAGYISALAYHAENLTDDQIKSVKDVPMWFVHSADDSTTKPEETVIPTYKRLKAAGAKNVYCSYYDHVTDITGMYGGKDYHHPGHWSWIYSHANLARKDMDGSLVKIKDRPVTIMEWMAAQRR
jgi:predicted peptidase